MNFGLTRPNSCQTFLPIFIWKYGSVERWEFLTFSNGTKKKSEFLTFLLIKFRLRNKYPKAVQKVEDSDESSGFLPGETDCFYIDMNGLIHVASHGREVVFLEVIRKNEMFTQAQFMHK